MKAELQVIVMCFAALFAASATATDQLAPAQDQTQATQPTAYYQGGTDSTLLEQNVALSPEPHLPSSVTSFGTQPASYVADEEEADVGVAEEEDGKVYYSQSCRCRRQSCGLGCCFEFGAWIDHGISFVANNPADRFNGVVGMNDRDDEYQMNQLWLYVERKTPIRGDGLSIGGRVDFVYGTDAQWMQSIDGLEESWNQTERFYQAALPQFYLDVAVNDWTFRMGHFITPMGYEDYMAPNNFFYSLSYAYNYAIPGTYLGMLARWDFSDQWAAFAGFHRGGDQFDDTDGLDAVNFLGGVSWSSADERMWADFFIDAEEAGPDDNTTIFGLVFYTELTDRLDWMIEWNNGDSTGADAEWYVINQHFIYEITPTCSLGMRFEWYRDDDGYTVGAFRQGNVATGPFVGDFYEITLGLDWQATQRTRMRPFVRWDWYDADAPGGALPFDAGDRDDQFMGGFDFLTVF